MTGADHYLKLVHSVAELVDAAVPATASGRATMAAGALANATVPLAATLIEQGEFEQASDLIVLTNRAMSALHAGALQDEAVQGAIKDLLEQIAKRREPISPESSTARMSDDDLRAIGIDPER